MKTTKAKAKAKGAVRKGGPVVVNAARPDNRFGSGVTLEHGETKPLRGAALREVIKADAAHSRRQAMQKLRKIIEDERSEAIRSGKVKAVPLAEVMAASKGDAYNQAYENASKEIAKADKALNEISTRLHRHMVTHEELARVLVEAYEQAAVGKGQERHGNGERFEDQQIVFFGLQARNASGVIFQACKKATEAQRLETDAAIRELLGAINYLAAGVITLRKLTKEIA